MAPKPRLRAIPVPPCVQQRATRMAETVGLRPRQEAIQDGITAGQGPNDHLCPVSPLLRQKNSNPVSPTRLKPQVKHQQSPSAGQAEGLFSCGSTLERVSFTLGYERGSEAASDATGCR